MKHAAATFEHRLKKRPSVVLKRVHPPAVAAITTNTSDFEIEWRPCIAAVASHFAGYVSKHAHVQALLISDDFAQPLWKRVLLGDLWITAEDALPGARHRRSLGATPAAASTAPANEGAAQRSGHARSSVGSGHRELVGRGILRPGMIRRHGSSRSRLSSCRCVGWLSAG